MAIQTMATAATGAPQQPVVATGKCSNQCSNKCSNQCSNQAKAYGCTFILAPCLSLKMSSEDHLLLASAAPIPGLALLLRSEVQPSARLIELILAEAAKSALCPAVDALLGAEALLGADANRLLAVPNAGGASRVSEALSIEVLSTAFGGRLLQTECEIAYWPAHGAMTDYSIAWADGTTLGVSVTRAMGAPATPYSVDAAEALLRKKLNGVLRSTEAACGQWQKQILHVWAPTASSASALEAAYSRIETWLAADTVVLISVCVNLAELFEEKCTKVAKSAKPVKGMKDTEHLRVLADSEPRRAEPRSWPMAALGIM